MTGKASISIAVAALASVITLAGCGAGSGSTTAGQTSASQTAPSSSGSSGSSAPGASSSAPGASSQPTHKASAKAQPTHQIVAQPTAVPAGAQKISFTVPALTGVKAYGDYTKIGTRVKVDICADDVSPTDYAVGALAVGSSSSSSMTSKLGVVVFPHRYGTTWCTHSTLLIGGHLTVHAFIGGDNGQITQTGPSKQLY
jgi:hypothetical protein